MADSSKAQDLADVGAAYARAFAGDLEALVGASIKIAAPTIETLVPDTVVVDRDPIALTRCHNKNDHEQVYFCWVSRSVAVTLACMLMGHPEERMKEMRSEPLDEEMLDAFGEVMNLGTALLSRMFTDDYALPPVGVLSTSEVTKPKADTSWIEGEEFVVARFPVSIPESEEAVLSIAFPPSAAHHWFGYDLGPFARREKAVHEIEEGDIEPTSVVFIDPDEETRNDIEDLEEGFLHSIWTIDPDEFDPDELDEFAEVGAFFIEWDLATRTGLDFVECLRGDELTAEAAILMMSSEPTDAKVRTALRSGADSFVTKPVELEEVSARLDPLLRVLQRKSA